MRSIFVLSVVVVLSLGCEPAREWQTIASELPEAVTSISGTSERDVWAVGADVGQGPLVLHWDGSTWERRPTGLRGAWWWVHAFSDGTAIMGGERGMIVRWDGAQFVREVTPGLARQTVFGVWGSAPNDVYAVGSGTSGRRGFLWHSDGTSWTEVPLPDDVPLRDGELPGLFKVWGGSANDVWAVGSDGLVLHKNADGWTRLGTESAATLFTVNGRPGRALIVGGGRAAALLETDGVHPPSDVSPTDLTLLQGVAADPTDPEGAYATGIGGAVFHRTASGWARVTTTGFGEGIESLHALWVDPQGGVWAVGGNVLTNLTRGTIVRWAPPKAATYAAPELPPAPEVVCPSGAIDPAPTASIARRWDEQILGAIRRDTPRPTVHARNLFHLSAAMWDAWAAYEPQAKPVFVTEHASATDIEAARLEAISYAAYRLLDRRYSGAAGGPISKACFRAFMTKLGFPPDDATITGDGPRALGNRVGLGVIAATTDDGSNEANGYADTTGFMSTAPALSVENPGPPAENIDLWQPLDLAIAATQNGIPLAPGVQKYVGPHWGSVKPFSLTRAMPDDLYVDPGEVPHLTPTTMTWPVEIIRRSAQLSATSTDTIDISPGHIGNNPLGSNAGTGYAVNPSTGQPYASNVVPLGDFGRVLAEVWADGPKSETPPGHWNVLANHAFAHPSFTRKWKGTGTVLSPLEWDVRAYLVLNGSLHDAAIAAWQIKRRALSSRPITLIRSSAARGQSSNASLPSYDARGLPLVLGLIELITAESVLEGRHAHLKHAIGQIAVRTWRGEPGDVHQLSDVTWMRGVEWIPYQKRDFVTPAFPGFISGHSTFSRAAAVVLSDITGSPYFPGGLEELRVDPAVTPLAFEKGPSRTITLQWATYFDAADQAGQSRLWGGIHIEPDDFGGRRVGARVGEQALTKAATYFP